MSPLLSLPHLVCVVTNPPCVPLQAFMRGKLKVKGNMGLAMKLGTVIKAAKSRSKL